MFFSPSLIRVDQKKLPGQSVVGRKFENVVGEALFREAFLLPLVLGAISM